MDTELIKKISNKTKLTTGIVEAVMEAFAEVILEKEPAAKESAMDAMAQAQDKKKEVEMPQKNIVEKAYEEKLREYRNAFITTQVIRFDAACLEKYMKKMDVTTVELAELLRISPMLVNQWMNEEIEPGFNMMKKLALLFGCDWTDFLVLDVEIQKEPIVKMPVQLTPGINSEEETSSVKRENLEQNIAFARQNLTMHKLGLHINALKYLMERYTMDESTKKCIEEELAETEKN